MQELIIFADFRYFQMVCPVIERRLSGSLLLILITTFHVTGLYEVNVCLQTVMSNRVDPQTTLTIVYDEIHCQ